MRGAKRGAVVRYEVLPRVQGGVASAGGLCGHEGGNVVFVRQVALVSEVADIPVKEVARISAALQKQVTRDFAPIWQVPATVDGFPALEDVPLGYWPVIIVQDVQGAAGVHLDKDGQPFALVEVGDSWS
jgi:hypothetical protein